MDAQVDAKREPMTVLKWSEMVAMRIAAKGTDCSRVFDLSPRELRELAEDMASNHHTVAPEVLRAIAIGDVITFAGQQIRVVPVSERELAQALRVNVDAFSVDQMLAKVADLSDHRDRIWTRLDDSRALVHDLELKLEREQLKGLDCATRQELERALGVEPGSFTMAQLLARTSNLVADLDKSHAGDEQASGIWAGIVRGIRAAMERDDPDRALGYARLAAALMDRPADSCSVAQAIGLG